MDDLLIKGLEFIDRFFTKVAGFHLNPRVFSYAPSYGKTIKTNSGSSVSLFGSYFEFFDALNCVCAATTLGSNPNSALLTLLHAGPIFGSRM
jgi:hypothetical protein